MGWEQKAKKMAMGNFVRAKKDMMVLITFIGEPKETVGKNFQQEEVDELDFPVDFYEVRSVYEKYQKGEAAHIVETMDPEKKVFAVQGGPLLRELMEVNEEESIIGRTFILKHTGEGQKTTYKLQEIFVTKQASIVKQQDEDQDDENDNSEGLQPEIENQEFAGPNPRKEPIQPPTRKRTRKPKAVDLESEAFKAKVAERAAKVKEEEALEQNQTEEPTSVGS
jgi:hypothetical protein